MYSFHWIIDFKIMDVSTHMKTLFHIHSNNAPSIMGIRNITKLFCYMDILVKNQKNINGSK